MGALYIGQIDISITAPCTVLPKRDGIIKIGPFGHNMYMMGKMLQCSAWVTGIKDKVKTAEVNKL